MSDVFKSLIMEKGAAKRISAKIIPDNATNKNVTFKSSNSNVSTAKEGLSKGLLGALKSGVSIITATTEDGGHTDSINVRIVNPNVFWCQTGGWDFGLNSNGTVNTGSGECARTAIATMASINTNSIVYPTDVVVAEKLENKVTINGKDHIRGNNASSYSFAAFEQNSGTHKGFNSYKATNEPQILRIINSELSNGRAIVILTNGSGEHWVTVTGTTTGKFANNFSELKGVDPWYNGKNPNNPTYSDAHVALYYSNIEGKNGVIPLINGVPKQKDPRIDADFHNDLRVFTVNLS